MNLDEELLRIVATETGAYVFTKLVSEGANVNITNGIAAE